MMLLSLAAGLCCGVISGLGIGGGSLLILYLLNIAELPQLTAQFINLVYFIPASGSALAVHIKNRLIDKNILIPAIIGGVFSAVPFSFIAGLISPIILKKVFGVFVIVLGLREIFSRD